MPEINHLAEVRDQVLAKIEDNPELYQPEDAILLKKNDFLTKRFLVEKKGTEAAADALNWTLLWRKQMGVNSGLSLRVPLEFYNLGVIGLGKDAEGLDVIYFRLSMTQVNDVTREFFQWLAITTVEYLENQKSRKQYGVVFDGKGAGYSNVDLPNIKFAIDVVFNLYPQSAKYICLHDAPFALRPLIPVMTAFIPKHHRDVVKVTNKRSLVEIIEAKNLPNYMGGQVRLSLDELKPSNLLTMHKIAEDRDLPANQIDDFMVYHQKNQETLRRENKLRSQSVF